MKDDVKVIQITVWTIKRKPKKIDIDKAREAILGLLELTRKEKEEKNCSYRKKTNNFRIFC